MPEPASGMPWIPAEMQLFGLPVHRVDTEGVRAFIVSTIVAGQRAVILHLNIYGVNLALRHQWLREFISGANLVFCDGDGVRLGLKLLGYAPGPKITYNEWIWQLARLCESYGFRLYLLGAKPGIAEEAAAKLIVRHPELTIVGTHHGYFDKQGVENDAVIQHINAAAPDVLLVCFGMPAQERWIHDNWTRLNAHVFLNGGAALDYASGRLAKAPAFMVRSHLEWLYRLLQEPTRLFNRYVIGNPLFLFRIFRERARLGWTRRTRPEPDRG
jgi:N-acetylglucosaminyldiphosphoundecaprenol N-acetyl-beta-D-mannosaminyltransferase